MLCLLFKLKLINLAQPHNLIYLLIVSKICILIIFGIFSFASKFFDVEKKKKKMEILFLYKISKTLNSLETYEFCLFPK